MNGSILYVLIYNFLQSVLEIIPYQYIESCCLSLFTGQAVLHYMEYRNLFNQTSVNGFLRLNSLEVEHVGMGMEYLNPHYILSNFASISNTDILVKTCLCMCASTTEVINIYEWNCWVKSYKRSKFQQILLHYSPIYPLTQNT